MHDVSASPVRPQGRALRLALLFTFALTALLGLSAPSPAAAAELLYGVDDKNRLVTLSSAAPGAVARMAITGLQSGDEIVALDTRPATKQLYALGRSSRIYQIDPGSAVATAVGSGFNPALNGSAFGFDFNPTVDRIRLASDARQNIRLHPDTGAIAAVDGTLTYAATDSGSASAPRLVGSAYTNSVAGATSTQLFGIDSSRDILVLQNPPNPGSLATIGALGVDVGDIAGFDIAGSDGSAFAALRAQGSVPSSLYRIDLGTGAATLLGKIGGSSPLRGIAAGGFASVDTTAPVLDVRTRSAVKLSSLIRSGLSLRVSCSEACTTKISLSSGGRVIATGTTSTELAGFVSLKLKTNSAATQLLDAGRDARLVLRVGAKDASGNPAAVVRKSLIARR